MKKKVYLLLVTVTALFILSGCFVIVPPEPLCRRELQFSWSMKELDEGYYSYNNAIAPYGIDTIEIKIEPIIAPSYGFEVWVMNYYQYLDFYYDGIVDGDVHHFTIYNEAKTLIINDPDPYETYYVIIDNSDLGWVETDWDGVNDLVIFNADVYFCILN
ncbi:MAG: hypothetical protein H0Z25_00145 [Kosmotoga sp.]|uniref:hypothetical protein n=1 Tax=Kosmotoga sp. TaxID=1955248 RepID=UPI001DA562B7|nr:hypothetical protein [Kosmotoga sp.]MBO8165614.1 hypothetical protein [Kosmotoga sp.]